MTAIQQQLAGGGGRFTRLLALPAALVAALLLGWLMARLIQAEGEAPPSREPMKVVRFDDSRQQRAQPASQALPQRPPDTPAPPLPSPVALDTPAPATPDLPLPAAPTERPSVTPDLKLGDLGEPSAPVSDSGEYLPMTKVTPAYPERARMQNLEGDCVVEYTVTPQGTTTDVRVVEDECENWLFRRPAVKAAQRFRYQPRHQNGQAVAVPGVRNRFEFRLE
ncbi:MAG: hypothetical protein CL543_11940 [Alcanivorax sp.]|nr:hypothetical protein [Alcanivorax sp.]